MKRRVLSFILALCVLFALTASIIVPASAATQSGAKAWMDTRKGKTAQLGGTQCVALFNQYLQDVFGIDYRGYHVDYAYQIYSCNFPTSMFSKIPANQINGNYQVGDIIIWKAGSGWPVGTAGHVGLVYSVSGSNVQVIEQNWPEGSNTTINPMHNTDYLLGLIRPKFTAPVIDPSKPVLVPEGVYALEPKHAPGMRLDVKGGSMDSEANIQLFEDNGSKAQQFRISASNGYYHLVCENSGMAVDLHDGVGVSGTNVQQYKVDGTKAQDWRFYDAGDGYYYIVPRQNNGLAIDVAGGSGANYTNIRVYDQNGTDAQKWKLIPAGTVTLTYDPNGGTDAPEAQSFAAGETVTLSRTIPVREGCAFLGWAVTADAAEAQYRPGDSGAFNGNTTLYAVWEPYDYLIGPLTVQDGDFEPLDAIPAGPFQVTVSITRQTPDSDALVFLAAYTAEGQYRGLMYVTLQEMTEGGRVMVTLPVENPTGDIASLKAFAVASFKDLTPLGPASEFGNDAGSR